VILRVLSYFSLFVIWVCLSAMCAVGASMLFGMTGSTVYGSWRSIVIGAVLGTILTAMLGYLMLTGHRMRRGRVLGPIYLCRSCGYDLRGAVGASACPECGYPISESRQSLLRVMHERGVADAARDD